jgi:hypothetical protein
MESHDAAGSRADLPVESFGRYEIVREIGRGGMATVFLARDPKHDRNVALKILAPELVAGLGAERFLREIGIAAHLTHPHILPLIDSGVTDGRPYYIMPYIDGESLRERLARKGPLSVEASLRIAEEVGEALAYAHDRGVVHRDVKPGNILLTDGGAVVADFGIAMALDQADERHLTRTGQSVGTIGYMSPEQASGDRGLDARSDQYSLAAVLFEMLTGEPPFTGRNARAVLGQQLSRPAPRLAERLDGIPEAIDGAVARALACEPEDRYPTAKRFVADLKSNVFTPSSQIRKIGAEATGVGMLLLLAIAGAWLIPAFRGERAGPGIDLEGIDPARYAVFPFVSTLGDSLVIGETQRLEDALSRWEGVDVVFGPQLRGAVDRASPAGLTQMEAARVAASQHAGRFVTGQVDAVGDSIRIQASLYEVTGSGPALLQSGATRFGFDLTRADSCLTALASLLLFDGDAPPDVRPGVRTRSYPARRAFEIGMRAVTDWDLDRADSAFSRAAAIDPGYAEAHLWSALVRAWYGADRSAWRIPVSQAVLHKDRLVPRDSVIAIAMAAQVKGNMAAACEHWRELTREHPNDFPVWYGLAVCLRTDRTVLPDPASPSKWSFQSSYQEAISAYQRAFDLLPSILASFHSDSYRSLRGLLMVSGSLMRLGIAEPPDSDVFVARPSWRGDTLAFIPRPFGPAVEEAEDVSAYSQAIHEQRRLFRQVAGAWVASSPRSARAHEALSVALMLLGDRSAIDTLSRARELASTEEESLQLAGGEVWLRVALSLPTDTVGLRQARSLADSLLELDASGMNPRLRASLAALRGRSSLAAAAARRIPPVDHSLLPQSIQADARALLTFAALLGPVDSLSRLEASVASGVERLYPIEARKGEREGALAVAATLAFPTYPFRDSQLLQDWLVQAQLALSSGDTAAVVAPLDRALEAAATLPPYISTLDALLPEAELLVAMGRPADAAELVDPSLGSLLQAEPNRLASPQEAGALVRMAALRARIADVLDNRTNAHNWAHAVTILWQDADPHLGGIVKEMEELTQ